MPMIQVKYCCQTCGKEEVVSIWVNAGSVVNTTEMVCKTIREGCTEKDTLLEILREHGVEIE